MKSPLLRPDEQEIRANDGPQALFLACPAKSVIYGGARGGGKSYALLLDFAKHAKLYGSAARGLLLRRHYKDLEDLVDKSKEIFWRLGWTFNEKPATWKTPEGAILRMRAIDKDADAEKYKGFNTTWLGIDEIGDFPNPRPLDKLWGSLRSAHGVPVVRRATANPGGSGHGWVFQRYIKNRKPFEVFEEVPLPAERPDLTIPTVFIPARLEDNPSLQKNDPSYEANLAMAGDAKLFKAWRYGDWSVLSGQYFDVFDPKIHVIDARRVQIQPWHQRWISMDWGFDDYTAVHWHALTEDNCVYTYRELYIRQKDSVTVGRLIVELNGDDQISQFYMPKDIVEKRGAVNTIGEQIASVTRPAGLPYPAEADMSPNSRIGGWTLMYQMLVSGRWLISDACPALIESLPLLIRDPDNPEDIQDSAVDHAPDSARYGLKSHIGHVKIPIEQQILEKIGKIENYTARAMAEKKERFKHMDKKFVRGSRFVRREARYGS